MMKKTLLLTIMLLSAVFIGTAWGQNRTNLTYDFENGQTISSINDDGLIYSNDAVYPWIVTNEANHTEGGSYCIKSGNAGFDDSKSSFSITVEFGAGGSINFWYKISSEKDYDKAYFDIDNETKIDGVSGDGSWTQYTFAVTEGKHTFKWYYEKDSSSKENDDCFYIDDIAFTNAFINPYPAPINFVSDEITANSITFSWYSNADSFELQYHNLSDNSWTNITDNVTNPYTLSFNDLEDGITYQIQVIGKWGENESDPSEQLTFTTPGTKSLPYYMDFETNQANTFTEWTKVDCEEETGIKTSMHYSGDRCFAFMYGSNPPQYLISPEFTGTTGVNMTFYYLIYNHAYPETFQVGYSTTTNDLENFVWHSEVTATDDDNWTLYEDMFLSGCKYVAIRYNSNDQYYLFIDDIVFTEAASCPNPTQLAINNITKTTADVSWVSDASNFNIQYKKLSSATWTSTTSTTNSCILEGLESETEYEVRVKAICGGEDGESDWSQSLQFITDYAIPVVINGSNRFYTDDFEGENLNWKFINGTLTNEWYWGTATNNGGSKAIYVSNDGGDHNTYTKDDPALVYATKTFTLSNTSYTISYDWKANGEPGISTDFDYLLVALVPASYVLTASNTTANPFYQGLPDGWISLTGNDRSMLSGSNDFQNLSVTVDIATAGDYKVVFAWRNDNQVSGNDAPAAIDNFSINLVEKPLDLVANAVVTSANVTWTPWGDETEWLLYYSTSNIDPADDLYSGENVVTVNDNPAYTITGLTSETTYYVWVRSNFGTRTYSDWTGPVDFTPSAISDMVMTNEGGQSYQYVPFDCGNVDNGTMSQFIVHAAQLTNVIDKQIIKMTFYTDEVDVDLGDATFDVYLKEIENVRFETEEFMDWSEMTKVYEGSLSIANNKMEVVFNTSYAYSDKNLLVGFKLINTGTVRNVLWYGKSYFNQQYGVFSTDDMGYSYPEPQYAHFLPMVKFSCGYDYNIFETAGNWNDDDNWSKTTPSETQDVLIQKDVTIPTGYTANAASITLDGGSLTIEDGGQLIASNSVAATVKKSIADPTKDGDYGHWYTISTPVHKDATDNVVISETNLTTMGASNYDMFYFDEAQGTWINQKTSGTGFSNMYVGKGYLYRNNGTDLVITGNTNSGDIEYTLTKDGSGDIAGFNLIGNPYPHDINLKHITYSKGENLNGCYILSDAGAWGSELAADATISPYQGFLVQADVDDKVATFHETAQRGAKSNGDNIKFMVANSQYEDAAYALFDKGFGLSKINHRNADIPMLYINQEDTDYAIATMSDDTKSFNLNFKAMTTGKYTLSYKADGNFSYLHVIDRLTGEDVDMLLEGEYSFIASPIDSENRFIVRLEYSAGSEISESSIFAYQSGNDIIVNGEGELQIFDMMGRRVLTQYVSGVETINLQLNGVYIFRLNEKTQKIVVK